MSKYKLIIASLMLVSGCSISLQKKINTALVVANTAIIACDMGQTIYMSDGGKWDHMSSDGRRLGEQNPLFITHYPHPAMVAGYSGLAAYAMIKLHKSSMDEWLKMVVNGTVLLMEGANVAVNYGGRCGLNHSQEPMVHFMND